MHIKKLFCAHFPQHKQRTQISLDEKREYVCRIVFKKDQKIKISKARISLNERKKVQSFNMTLMIMTSASICIIFSMCIYLVYEGREKVANAIFLNVKQSSCWLENFSLPAPRFHAEIFHFAYMTQNNEEKVHLIKITYQQPPCLPIQCSCERMESQRKFRTSTCPTLPG